MDAGVITQTLRDLDMLLHMFQAKSIYIIEVCSATYLIVDGYTTSRRVKHRTNFAGNKVSGNSG